MKSIEFYDLPRPDQDRFVSAAQASLAPAPIAVHLASRFVGARWFIAAAAGVLITLAFIMVGYGDLEHPAALASGFRAFLYCIGFTLSFGCLARGLNLREQANSLPYARGVYLFPVGVVRATSSQLEVHSVSELQSVRAGDKELVVEFRDGATFRFPANSKEQAEAAKVTVEQSQERLDEAERADSIRSLAALDPLCRTNFPSPFSQDVPYTRPAAMWSMALLGMAVASGAALGIGGWQVRNTLSERKLAEDAKRLDTTTAYRNYIERGGEREEIAGVLLPRAELAEAKAAQSVGAIEKYIERHPTTRIAGEVEQALKSALLRELDKARQAGTLAALDKFQEEFPRHSPVTEELAQARHAVYEAAADRAASMAETRGGKRPQVADFFRQLVAYAEEHGPKVLVRFRSQLGKSHKRADTYVRRSAYFGGNATLPSRYFRGDDSRSREKLAADILIPVLQSAFPEEIVRFELGPSLEDLDSEESDRSFPQPDVPTLFIHHRTELSGSHISRRPRGIFLGAGIFFHTKFAIPGSSASLAHKVSTWKTPSRRVMRHKGRKTSDVYEDLARRSFSLFVSRFLPQLLDKTPEDMSLPRIDLLKEEEEGE